MAIKMEGPLSKWTNVMKGWQYRWFVLDNTSGILSYYTSKEKMMKGSRRGCVRLKGAVIGIDDEDDSTFTITVDHKTFHFQARDEEERERWIEALESAICQLSGQRDASSDSVATLEDFEKKLMETDAYLQLLIEQNQAIAKKIDECPNETDKERYNIIKVTADAMIEAIKHSIVQLQISKESLKEPLVNGNAQDLSMMTDCANFDHFQGAALSVVPSSSTENLCQASCSEKLQLCAQTSISLPNLLCSEKSACEEVPERSYSSSEDEEFYDAPMDGTETCNSNWTFQQEPLSSPSRLSSNPSRLSSSPSKLTGNGSAISQKISVTDASPKPPPKISFEEDFYDELYDDRSEADVGNMEDHGSVVGHLLSQVRIGMDLTKVVLPTFILERRSLLEMFADFFAHPEQFCKVADLKTPKERMVQVVKWYLGMFHAGRPSEVAKKPYNPIIGETFKCFWNVPKIPKSEERSDHGPTPWCRKSNLSFVAEQVSHHPPITAFYAENFDKRIMLDGYTWTKSKFLGLSIGVHFIGKAVVSVINHDEEYVLGFPSGYGRSILTVPWVELGGDLEVTCAKSGYHAKVEFHTKPFYGNKKHRVSANIFEPGVKKPFVTIDGEWNGVMFAKYASGKNETFVDTKNDPMTRKQVKPHAQQGEFESRRLWRVVTQSLKDKNVEKATAEKQRLEARQREEAKERKEKNKRWKTQHFKEVGENWVFRRSLAKRLQPGYNLTGHGSIKSHSTNASQATAPGPSLPKKK